MNHILLVESTTTQPRALQRAASAAGHRITWIVHDLSAYGLSPAALPPDVAPVTGVDTGDPAAVAAAAIAIHQALPVDACLTTSEGHLPATAAAAAALGLRHEPPEQIARLRDKAAVRTALSGTGVPQPPWRQAAAPGELDAALKTTGLPAVVKPVDGSGSIGVAVVRDRASAQAALHDVLGRMTFGRRLPSARRALIERFMPGELVSVESFSRDGRHVPLAVTRKTTGGLTGAVELGGALLPATPGTLADSEYAGAVAVAVDALTALEFRDGASHIEIIVGPGGPWLVEVNGRIAGGPIPAALDLVLDQPVLPALIDLHLSPSRPLPRPVAAAAVGALTSPISGRLTVFEPSALVEAGVADVALAERAPGDIVGPPRSNRDRLGFLLCRGDSPGQAEERLARALSQVRIDVTPENEHAPEKNGDEAGAA